MPRFNPEQVERYSRQIILPEVGGRGQERLLESRVFIVGAGGLGSPVGYYLAAAGVGTIGLGDADRVDRSNLQRQIAHSTESLGINKAESARATFERLNPDVRVEPFTERLTKQNIMDVFRDYDIVVDGSDNFPTRYLVNDASFLLGKPLVSGAVLRFEGQVTTMIPREGHCYRCLFEEPPPEGAVPSCQEAGILGAVTGVIGSLQAAEVLKLILGIGAPLSEKLLIYDALKAGFRTVPVHRNPSCALCGEEPTITEPVEYGEASCSIPEE